jgi:hypothetical protein
MSAKEIRILSKRSGVPAAVIKRNLELWRAATRRTSKRFQPTA